ncbi:MAG: dephospho-CoA kinase [Planctomycetota bacterium]
MNTSTKPVIGLLGGPGSGKSYVAQQLAELGAAVIDADAIAREVLDHADVKEALVEWWGSAVLGDDGGVNRSVVGSKVFDNPDELARLEGLVHPKINTRRCELRERFSVDDNVVAIVEDCPLLLERGLEADSDLLVFVEVPKPIRLQRVAASRGWSAEELDRREKNQMPLDIKRKRADYVVQNSVETPFDQHQARRLLDRAISKYS